jgi:hypothetical protein
LQHGLERETNRDCSKWSARRVAAVWLAAGGGEGGGAA